MPCRGRNYEYNMSKQTPTYTIKIAKKSPATWQQTIPSSNLEAVCGGAARLFPRVTDGEKESKRTRERESERNRERVKKKQSFVICLMVE